MNILSPPAQFQRIKQLIVSQSNKGSLQPSVRAEESPSIFHFPALQPLFIHSGDGVLPGVSPLGESNVSLGKASPALPGRVCSHPWHQVLFDLELVVKAQGTETKKPLRQWGCAGGLCQWRETAAECSSLCELKGKGMTQRRL